MKNKIQVSDAAESNAGDDFHVLWTLKRALDLLNFQSDGLRAIIVEGVETELAENIDASRHQFLGADLVEYYGGERFAEATSIIVSQVKYSTRRVTENITISELYTEKRGPGSSIIAKLAKIHQGLQQVAADDQIKEKARYRLVSNRSFSDVQLEKLEALRKKIAENPGLLWSEAISDSRTSKKALEKLWLASGLNDKDFALFFSLVDFSYCGTDSKAVLERDLVWAIARTSVSSRHQFNGLYKMILNKMLPDAARKITTIDIIANLGFTNGSLESLFPVSQAFEKVANPIFRAQVSDIVAEILDPAGHSVVCLHGVAGIGKSTLTQQLLGLLPDHSYCLRFDCYGAGAYLDSDDRRHLHRQGIVHLCNELAKEFGTDFLINFSETKEIYIKEFKRRIADAVRILKQRNSGAMLLIIVDAADNSITAAQKMSEQSFVPDLLSMAIPAGCKIMVTSRSYRKESLELPATYSDIELKPFTGNESSTFLRANFPDASEEECDIFHELTGGIPRVQSYALDMKDKGLASVLDYLRPDGKSLENIIDEKIQEAVKRIGNKGSEQVASFFTHLITLPRPVPIEYIEQASGLSQGVVSDLTTDLWHGIPFNRGLISFRDEDFENHIREKYTPTALQVETIAELFIDKATTDEYASINLASVLVQAGMGDRLKKIVLARELMTLPTDPIRNKDIYGRRTQIALKVSTEQNDTVTYIKLLLIAAEETKTGAALRQLQVDNPELVMQFGHPASLNLLNQQTSTATWGGSFHMKLAAFSARIGDLKDARLHLVTAHKWLAWKADSVPDDEHHQYKISDEDIACETEAIFYLYGMEKAWRNLRRWSPESLHLPTGKLVTRRLIENIDSAKLFADAVAAKWRIDALLFVYSQANLYGNSLSLDLEQTLAKLKRMFLLLSSRKSKISPEFKSLILGFCKIALNQPQIDKADIINIIDAIGHGLPKRLPFYLKKASYGERDGEDMHQALSFMSLKSYCLDSKLTVKETIPEYLQNPDSEKNYEKREAISREKREYESFYKYAVAVHNLQAILTDGSKSHDAAREEIERICLQISRDYEFSFLNGFRAKERMDYISQELFVAASALPDAELLLQKIVDTVQGKAYMVNIWYSLLDQTRQIRGLHSFHLKILRDLETHFEESDYPASELTENYLKCCLYSQSIDPEIGKYYFDKAVEAVNDIDDEAVAKINCIRDLSEVRLPAHNAELAFNVARFTEYCRNKLSQYDEEHFPFLQSLLAISSMDPATLFTTLCRWDHRNTLRIESHLIPLIHDLLKVNYIDHKMAAGLLPVGSRYEHWHPFLALCKSILDGFDLAQDSTGKSGFLRFLIRDLTVANDYAMIAEIYNHIAHGRFVQSALLAEYKNIVEFEQNVNGKETRKSHTRHEEQRLSHKLNLSDYDYLSSMGLEEALKALESAEENHNAWLFPKVLLVDFSDNCLPAQYVRFLDALIDVRPELLSSHTLHDALSVILKKWEDHQGVRLWKKNNFQKVIVHWFDHIYDDGRFNFYNIEKSQEVFGVSDSELAGILISLLPAKVDILTPDSLYNIVRIIASRINPEQNLNILQWLLPRWSAPIKSDFADGIYSSKVAPAATVIDSITGLLRYLLGHPHKPKRWTAMHSIRRLAALCTEPFIKSLLDKQNITDNIPFQDGPTLYYWISAKLYLHIAIERISRENPHKLVAVKETLLEELSNTHLPHVLIRDCSKHSCQNLSKSGVCHFTPEQLILLKGAFSGPSGQEPKDSAIGVIDQDNEPRFRFNSTDTIPYWYSPLAGLFFGNERPGHGFG